MVQDGLRLWAADPIVYLKIEMDRAFGQLDRRVYGRGRWIAPSGSWAVVYTEQRAPSA